MTNVQYKCMEPGCRNVGYLPPNTTDDIRCGRHKVDMVQVEETEAVIEHPERYLTTNVIPSQPTSIDASPDGLDYRIGDVQGAFVSQGSTDLALTNVISEKDREEFMADFHGQDFSDLNAQAESNRDRLMKEQDERDEANRGESGMTEADGAVGGHASKPENRDDLDDDGRGDVGDGESTEAHDTLGDLDEDDPDDDPDEDGTDDGADTETIEHLPADDDLEGWQKLYQDRTGSKADGRRGVHSLKSELGY